MSATTTFIATSLAVALPWAYFLRRSPLSWSTAVSVLLLLHSLAGLYSLLLQSPPNVFTTLQIPLNTPTDAIRSLLIQRFDTELNPELEELLRRLASFDVRALYPRFGHNAIATCSYCRSIEDFALYTLPRPIMSYIREIAFIGLITTRRRKAAVTALFFMCLLELYILATVDIRIPLRNSDNQKTIWWHDTLLNIRRIIFLIAPILVHFSPPLRIPFISPPAPAPESDIDSASILAETHQALLHLLPSLHLVKYAQAAMMRVPELRARAGAWWEEEARVGGWIRGDGVEDMNVQKVARDLGLAFNEGAEDVEEGKLRTSANIMTKVLIIDGLKESSYWHQH